MYFEEATIQGVSFLDEKHVCSEEVNLEEDLPNLNNINNNSAK